MLASDLDPPYPSPLHQKQNIFRFRVFIKTSSPSHQPATPSPIFISNFDSFCQKQHLFLPQLHPRPPLHKKNQIWIICQNSLTHYPPPPPPPPNTHTYTAAQRPPPSIHFLTLKILCQNSLTKELKIRVVGFVLKNILTYFEVLIVPHSILGTYSV